MTAATNKGAEKKENVKKERCRGSQGDRKAGSDRGGGGVDQQSLYVSLNSPGE